jgi:adenylate cyclase
VRAPALIAAVASLVVLLDLGGHLDGFERKTLDARYRFFASPGPHTGDIVILNISEEAIRMLEPFYGRWPWPRAVHADAIDYLEADGARAIGFDILFSERALRQEVDAATIGELKALAKNADLPEVRAELQRRLDAVDPALSDAWFVERVGRSSNVFQASVFHVAEDDLALDPGLAADEEQAVRIRSALSASAVPTRKRSRDPVFFNATVPFEALARASRGVGHINYLPDGDGVCRRFMPLAWLGQGEAAYPSLALIVAAALKGVPPKSIGTKDDRVVVGDIEIPLLPDGSALINYRGGRVTDDPGGRGKFESFYRHISYEAVLASADYVRAGKDPPLAKGTFANKVVLVTASAAGLADLRATPFSPVTPGVEIHANIIDNVLSGGFLRRLDGLAEKGYVLALALLVGAIAARTRPQVGAVAVALLASGVMGFHWALFGHGWVLPIVSVAVALVATYLGVVLLKYAAEEKEKTRIRAAFGHYLAPQVLEEVLRSPERLRLGGERRRVTVLFSDIEGFSSLSERLAAEEVAAILNEYLDRMMACIKQTGGTLDKFIGDAVMAEWNAPVAQPDHAARACETALLMAEETARLGEKWRAEGKPPLNMRIGINTGEMIVGNLGSSEIFDYTVIGDEVNVAARLEPLNKDFASRIAVSASTRGDAEAQRPGRFVFRRLVRVALKGKTAPLDVSELVGARDAVTAERMAAIGLFERGIDAYLARRFAEARTLFGQALEREPQDGPARRYLEQCTACEAAALPPDWQGVYVQESK